MNKLIKVLGFTAILMLVITSLIIAQNDVSFESIRFFESGYGAVPQSERVYTTYFPTAKTRYVYFELYVKNNRYNIGDNPVSITAKYYKPDGSLFGEPVLNFTIPSNWETAYLWQGWGWIDAGNWTPGTYRVVIYMDNAELTEALFSVYDKYWTSR